MKTSITFTYIYLFGVALAAAFPADPKPHLIVGGTEASPGEFPFIVQLKDHDCGGTILNSQWILTAAHCTQDDANAFIIVAGEHDVTKAEGTEQFRGASQIINHENYDTVTKANDISLIKLSTPLILNDAVQAAPLVSEDPSGDVTVAGWGTLSFGGAIPDVLMKVTVPIVPLETCRSAYGELIKDGMICAGVGGKDSCQGDSGGPLFTASGDLAGVVSWGYACADPVYPGIYSSIAYFTPWILEKMGHLATNEV